MLDKHNKFAYGTWWVDVFLWIISISCNFELGQNKSYFLVRFISQESGNQLLIFLSCYNAWIFHLPPKHIFLQTTNQKHDFEIESIQRKTYSINFRFQFFPAKWDYFYASALFAPKKSVYEPWLLQRKSTKWRLVSFRCAHEHHGLWETILIIVFGDINY